MASKTEVSDMDMQKLRVKCIKAAKAHGHPEHADDFASFVIVKAFDGLEPSNLKSLLVDYLRETMGHSRTEAGKKRYSSTTHYLDLSEVDKDPEVKRIRSLLSGDRMCKNWAGLYDQVDAKTLTFQHRICFLLLYKWEFEKREIAEILGKDPGRVSQLLKELHNVIRKKLTHEQILEFMEGEINS